MIKKYPHIITNDRLVRNEEDITGDYKTPEQAIPTEKQLDGTDWAGSLQTGALQNFAFRAFDVDFEEVDVPPWRVLLQQGIEGLHGDGDGAGLAAALAVGLCNGGPSVASPVSGMS